MPGPLAGPGTATVASVTDIGAAATPVARHRRRYREAMLFVWGRSVRGAHQAVYNSNPAAVSPATASARSQSRTGVRFAPTRKPTNTSIATRRPSVVSATPADRRSALPSTSVEPVLTTIDIVSEFGSLTMTVQSNPTNDTSTTSLQTKCSNCSPRLTVSAGPRWPTVTKNSPLAVRPRNRSESGPTGPLDSSSSSIVPTNSISVVSNIGTSSPPLVQPTTPAVTRNVSAMTRGLIWLAAPAATLPCLGHFVHPFRR